MRHIRLGTLVTEKKSDYEIHHKSYTSAVQNARDLAEKRGFEIDEDSWESSVTHGGQGRRPAEGKTTSMKIPLLKNGKPVKHMLVFQVYGMRTGFELTAYIS